MKTWTASRLLVLVLLLQLLTVGARAAAPLGVLVPAYFYPEPGGLWHALSNAATRIPLIAILNPDNGPGLGPDPEFLDAAVNLQNAGGLVIGYVTTGYGTSNLTTVQEEMDRYLAWYPVDGIFLDEMSFEATPGELDYYSQLYQFIKSRNPALMVVGNPGTQPDEDYFLTETADTLVIYEDGVDYEETEPDEWVSQHPARRFGQLPHSVASAITMSNYVQLARQRNIGWIYVTDDVEDNPWDMLSGYWADEVEYVRTLNQTARPFIVRQPASRIVSAGSNATFTLTLHSAAAASYQWFRAGMAMIGATNASLSFSAQPASAGGYFVVVSNAFGSTTSQVATLTVETTFTRVLSGPVVSDTLHSRGAGWGDFNNDGWPDLAVANSGDEFLFLNNGNGTFTRVTDSPVVSRDDNSVAAAWGDYDNDGWLDLLVSNNDGTDGLYRNLANGTFASITNGPVVNGPGHSAGVAWADYDRDGWLDLFIATQDFENDNLYRNNRDGTFTKSTSGGMVNEGADSQGCVWGDYNNDGWPDLFVAAFGTNYLYRNDGGGNFTSMTNLAPAFAGYGSGTGAWADYDNDGDLDLLVANVNGLPDQFFRNEGGTNFVEISEEAGLLATENSIGCSWADFDNDGFIDFYIAAEQTNLLYRNTGTGAFARVLSGAIGTDTGAFFINGVWADYDGNGFPDLFVTTYEGTPNRLYRNEGNSNAWLKVRCQGVASNRSAIGAKVRVLAVIGGTNRWQMREISGGDSWGSQNDLVQLFGLGDATNVLTVRVEWPSGKITELHHLPPRQTIIVSEPVEVYAAVNGPGVITISPQTNQYFPSQVLILTATPRNTNWTRFMHWSDGNTNATRSYTVGFSNVLTAVFTNFVPLEFLVMKQWEANFGGTNDDRGYSIQQTSDGGYIFGGRSDTTFTASGNKSSPGHGANDYWVIKIDVYGGKQWEKVFGGASHDDLRCVQETIDGGYMLGGYSLSPPSGNKTASNRGGYDIWVVRLDAGGNKLWEQTYGGTQDDQLAVLKPTTDGGFILGGTSASSPSGNKTSPNYGTNDMWIVRIDGSGNKLWDQSYGGSGDDGLNGVQPCADGGFVLGGYSFSASNGSKTTTNYGLADFWVMKITREGFKQWEGDFGGAGDDQLKAVSVTPDAGILLGGYSGSGVTGNKTAASLFGDDYWLVRLDEVGNKVWDYAYGGTNSDHLEAMSSLREGGSIVGGYSLFGAGGNKTAPSFGSRDFWIARVDASGGKLWDFSFGGTNDDTVASLQQTQDGGFIVGGYSGSSVGGNKGTTNYGVGDFWAIKLFSGEQPVGTPIVLVNGMYGMSNSFSIPATNTVSITFTSTFPNGYVFYTLDGSMPVPGENAIEYSSPSTPGVPFSVSNSVMVNTVAYSNDETMSAAAEPVLIQILPLYTVADTTPGGGGVAMNPPGGVYLSNAVVTLTAVPSNGWSFLRWEGAATGTNNPLALTMNRSHTIRAVFGTALTTTTNLAGASVALWPPTGPYPYGSLVRLVGVPGSGNRFNRWFSNISGPTSNPMEFTVLTANTNVSAFFAALSANSFALTTLLNGYGTVTRSPSANSYASNTMVTLTAVPDTGHAFTGWSGDINVLTNPLPLVMTTNKTVAANFALIQPPVIFTQPTNQTLFIPSSGALVVSASGTPVLHYQWQFNGTNLPGGTNAVLTFTNLALGEEGSYRCIITNNYGSVTSAVAVLTVLSGLGVDWQLVTNSAPWSQRAGMALVEFQNKLWLMGGGTSDTTNDVWFTPDGVQWTLATTNAGWPKRLYHRVVVFNNELWLLGGRSTGVGTPVNYNDVWRSTNGVDWVQATASAAWCAVDFAAVSFQGQLFVLGGNCSGAQDQVWTSANGVDWTLVPGPPKWGGRQGLGATVFNGRIWVAGGEDGFFPLLSDVWSSPDGTNWLEHTAAAGWYARWHPALTVLNGALWIYGGISPGPQNWNDVWSSSNGADWSQATNSANWPGRPFFSGGIAFNHRLWVFGERTGGAGTDLNDVWCSPPLLRLTNPIPPVVTLTNPAPGAVYNAGANIALAAVASASASDGLVTNVSFFADLNFLGSVFNALPETNSFSLTWSNVPAGNYTLTAVATDDAGLSATSAPVSITVNEAQAQPQFSMGAASYVVAENVAGGVLQVTVSKSASSVAASVVVQTRDGLATAVSGGAGDYQAFSNVLHFAAGEISRPVIVTIVNDALSEGNHEFEVFLSNPSAGVLFSPTNAVITIVDDDVPSLTNSVTAFRLPDPVPPLTGLLRVLIEPTNASGQWRFPWDLHWRNGGDLVTGLPAGNYPVEFRPLAGYYQPPDTVVGVTIDAITTNVGVYLPDGGQPLLGSLQVNLPPSNTLGALARWRLQGQTNLHAGGAVVSNLSAGVHVVEFNAVAGWVTPAPVAATVFAGQVNSRDVSYLVAETASGTGPSVLTFQDIQESTNAVINLPWWFNGQLQSDAGFASGFVVKERVVLTAAHTVFNDASLSYVTGARWFFQKQRGSYDPPAQMPRGWYVFSGYADQRTNDTPGMSSLASRQLDVAALYFTENAAGANKPGRGGWGGFLVSDAPTNEWLRGAASLKTLVGYPMDTVAEANRGRMHRTPEGNRQFEKLFEQVYATPDIFSHPGNSGGPLCVKHPNGSYYPAAVYLGGAGQSVVRAIDSQVVDLINRAEVSGNGGGNNTSGGIISINLGGGAGSFCAGFVRIELDTNSVAAGGGWRVPERNIPSTSPNTFTSDATIRVPLQGGPFSIVFKNVPGHLAPTNRSVQAVCGQSVFLTVGYAPLPPRLELSLEEGLRLLGSSGVTYRIERANALPALDNWVPFNTVTLNSASQVVTNTRPTNNPPVRFYRAVSP